MNIIELLTILKEGESSAVEFKKSTGSDFKKVACAFVNTNGGRIFLGIEDNGNPVGLQGTFAGVKQKISNDLQVLRPIPSFTIEEIPIARTRIVLIKIEESSLLTTYKNVVYVRAGTNCFPLSIGQVIEKSAESLRVFFDELVTEISFSKINGKMFKNFLKERERIRGVKIRGSLEENALMLRVAKKKDGKLFLTNGGLLCFVDNPQEYLPGSSVRLVVFDDNEMKTYSDRKEFRGSLPRIVQELEIYFSKNLGRVGGFTLGFKAKEYVEYPFSALREAIINAVIHRNYFDPSEIQIFVFPSHLEIRNPGSFPPGVTVKNPEHKPRNPSIAQYFFDLGLSEKYGSGVNKIIGEVGKHPLSEVEFVVRPYRTKLIFKKTMSNVKLDIVNQKILGSITQGRKNSTEIASHVGLSRQAVVTRLSGLKTLGLVRQVGEGPSTVYVLSR